MLEPINFKAQAWSSGSLFWVENNDNNSNRYSWAEKGCRHLFRLWSLVEEKGEWRMMCGAFQVQNLELLHHFDSLSKDSKHLLSHLWVWRLAAAWLILAGLCWVARAQVHSPCVYSGVQVQGAAAIWRKLFSRWWQEHRRCIHILGLPWQNTTHWVPQNNRNGFIHSSEG